MNARTVVRNAALITPLVLCNAVAVYGQCTYALAHITQSLALALVFAGALESIAIFLAVEAHSALMAGDAALRLRLGSYAVALIVGALNYANHAGPNYSPTAAAIAFGGLSTLSPFLWAIRSRSMRRAELREAGLIDARTVRFSAARWLLYPARTARVFRHAVWAGITDPADAIAAWDRPAFSDHGSADRREDDGAAPVPTSTDAPNGPEDRSSRGPDPSLPGAESLTLPAGSPEPWVGMGHDGNEHEPPSDTGPNSPARLPVHEPVRAPVFRGRRIPTMGDVDKRAEFVAALTRANGDVQTARRNLAERGIAVSNTYAYQIARELPNGGRGEVIPFPSAQS